MQASDAFTEQARACAELGSPMYADLLGRAAADLAAGGVVAAVLRGHEDDPGPSALALRLLGSVHRLVLARRAGALAAYYPSVGGTWEASGGWRAFADLLAREPAAVREWLDRPPQTNEVGRAAALYGGLLHLPRAHPVRLVEIGCSGGLNLRADRFGYRDEDGTRFGPDDAGLVLDGAWRGRPLDPWPDLQVTGRWGSDLLPVDVGTTEGRLTLTAYCWPDQRARLERLRAAFAVAAVVPARVERRDAVAAVERVALERGATTVLWHSVMWQYLTREEQRRIRARLVSLGEAATPDQPFAHLRAEPERRAPGQPHEFLVRLRCWPGGEDRVLGVMAAHGVPTTWE